MENSINWDQANLEDFRLTSKICLRAIAIMPTLDFASMQMDIIATHISGCPLKLKKLLNASRDNFFHDICGIRNHLDRTTGKLQDCFLPRFAV